MSGILSPSSLLLSLSSLQWGKSAFSCGLCCWREGKRHQHIHFMLKEIDIQKCWATFPRAICSSNCWQSPPQRSSSCISCPPELSLQILRGPSAGQHRSGLQSSLSDVVYGHLHYTNRHFLLNYNNTLTQNQTIFELYQNKVISCISLVCLFGVRHSPCLPQDDTQREFISEDKYFSTCQIHAQCNT